jgi:hypothetical protein
MRLVDFDEGFTTPTPPSVGTVTATALAVYASDAAYVTAKGAAAANGDAYYSSTDNVVRIYRGGAWEYLGQLAVTGGRGSAQAIIAGTGVAFSGKRQENLWFVVGSAGPVVVSASPQIAVGQFVGQRLRVFGTDDTNTVKFTHGTGLSLLASDVVLSNGDSIEFIWDGTNWAEIERSS